MMRFGVSPRACWAMWVEGWKKWSRSQALSSLSRVWFSSSMGNSRSVDVEAEILEVGEGFEAVARALAAHAGLLHAAERDGRTGDLHPVDRHHAVFEGAAEPQGSGAIFGNHV